jgi:hypothetical protein
MAGVVSGRFTVDGIDTGSFLCEPIKHPTLPFKMGFLRRVVYYVRWAKA